MTGLDLYPGGKPYALTMSYDDGNHADRRLAGIFDKYGIKGTFHLNSGRFDAEGSITSVELKELYKNHEVSVHTVTHPFLEKISVPDIIREITEDKRTIEALCGYPVRGMSYPFGTYSAEVIGAARLCGMEYSRTTAATMSFDIPKDFMKWHPTCHHRNCMEIIDKFDGNIKTRGYAMKGSLLYIWGHSYEFDRENNWDYIEEFCSKAGGREDIWYATNIEVLDYIAAQRNLKISADGKMIYNPAAISVWVSADGKPVEIKGGETVRI